VAEEKARYYLQTYGSAVDTLDTLNKKLDEYERWLKDEAKVKVNTVQPIGFNLERAKELLADHKVRIDKLRTA